MPRARRPVLALLLLLAAACGGDSDSHADGGAPDAAIDPTPVEAVPGARCAADDRVGVVEVTVGRVVRADLFDRRDPWIAAPLRADSACALHSFEVQQCDGCADDEICGADARCTRIPRRDPAGRLVLRAGGDDQVFEADATTGELGGAITLAGDRFALEVAAFGQTVTLESETGVPDRLSGFSAVLLGTYDAPEGIAATWDAVADGGHLFTRIPINHHAAGPTFTECAGEASAGSLDIGQPMLEPLAVATGLEFQFFDHVRFAAAETSRGCVEIRFSNRQSVGLEGI